MEGGAYFAWERDGYASSYTLSHSSPPSGSMQMAIADLLRLRCVAAVGLLVLWSSAELRKENLTHAEDLQHIVAVIRTAN